MRCQTAGSRSDGSVNEGGGAFAHAVGMSFDDGTLVRGDADFYFDKMVIVFFISACAFPVDEDELEGRVCYGGLDLSSTTDLTAFALAFPSADEEDKYIVLPYFWVPEETLDLRVKRDHVPYDVWEKNGFLETTEGNVVHYGYIEKFIERLGERFYIREIAYDRWGAAQMSQDLEGM